MVEEEAKEGYIEELIECPFCGGFVLDEFECILCGEEILESEMVLRTKTVCSKCRTEVNEDSQSCPECEVEF